MSVTSVITDWAIYLIGLILTPFLGIVYRNRDRSLSNERKLHGDDDDPHNDGLLTITHDTRNKVNHLEDTLDEFRRETKQEHQAVMNRLEEMSNE